MCTFPHVINPDAVWKQIISFTLRSRCNCSKQYDDISSRRRGYLEERTISGFCQESKFEFFKPLPRHITGQIEQSSQNFSFEMVINPNDFLPRD